MTTWWTRRASVQDKSLLIDLAREAFGNRAWTEKSLADCLTAKSHGVLFGGDQSESAKGFAIWRNLGDEAELLTIGVSSSAQNKGLGAAMLSRAFALMQQEGVSRLFLEVSAANEAAKALYQKAGFENQSRRKDYYPDGSDALIMVRKL